MPGIISKTYTPPSLPQNNPLSPTVPPNNPVANQYKLFNQGVNQGQADYSGIMQGYKSLANQAQGRPQQLPAQGFTPQAYKPQQVSAQQYRYTPSTDVTASMKNLSDLTTTGGYSPEDISNLRARGISPIRSVYANAQQNVNRQRALSGGYSPNFNAVQAKMAREASDQIANQTTNVNAGLAQNIAQNKLAAAPMYSSAAQHESDMGNQYGMQNTEAINRANELNTGNVNAANQFNITGATRANEMNMNNSMDMMKFNEAMRSGDQNRILEALRGMQGIYGTTPAQAQLFGNQALQGAQFQNQMSQQQLENALHGIGTVGGMIR